MSADAVSAVSAASRGGGQLLRRMLARNTRWLVPGSILLALHQLCEAAVPVLIGITVDRAVATGSVSAIVLWIGALAALFLALTTTYRQGARLVMRGFANEAHLLRVAISRKVLDPRGIRTDHETGALLSIASSDTESAAEVIDHVPTVIGAVVATIASGIVLLTISVPLGLIVLAGVPLVVLGLQVSAPMIVARVEAQQDQIGRATALAADLVRGQRPLQGIGAQASAAARYRVANRRSLVAALRASRVQSVHAGASAAAGALAAAAVALAAAYFTLHGDLSVGALITVIGLAQFLVEPFSVLAIAPSWVADAGGAANRIADVLDAPTRHPEPTHTAAPPPSGEGVLRIDGADHDGLQDLSLRVDAGEYVAVVAPTGRDAAALMALLSGEVRGNVSVDGRAVTSIPHGEMPATLLAEHHDGELFSGTMESNLALSGRSDFTAALDASGAHEVVALHDDGIAHPIVERGGNLSGGQRQRLTLARALAADPTVLVLHDPTTAVDAVTEQFIADGVKQLREGRTTIVLTNSPALLAVADRVVLILEGRIVAQGTHQGLLDGHDDYAQVVAR